MEVYVQSPQVVEAARTLILKLDKLNADPRFRAIWRSAEIHGLASPVLDYTAELESLRRTLVDVEGHGKYEKVVDDGD